MLNSDNKKNITEMNLEDNEVKDDVLYYTNNTYNYAACFKMKIIFSTFNLRYDVEISQWIICTIML